MLARGEGQRWWPWVRDPRVPQLWGLEALLLGGGGSLHQPQGRVGREEPGFPTALRANSCSCLWLCHLPGGDLGLVWTPQSNSRLVI